jgi:hypothetical protein
MSNVHCFITLNPFLAGPGPQFAAFDNTLDQDSMEEGAMRRAIPTVETVVSLQETAVLPPRTTRDQGAIKKRPSIFIQIPRKRTSLGDLPLELLFMIFDYIAYSEDQHYLILFAKKGSSEPKLIISQPALLMVCTYLRFALSGHFYSSRCFQSKIGTMSMVKSAASSLTVQQIEDKLPHPLKLSAIKLTTEIRELSERGFDLSILVKLGEMLFTEYRNKNHEIELVGLRWRLVCTDTSIHSTIRGKLNDDLRLLLECIHLSAARSASIESNSLREFSSSLEKWLSEERNYGCSTYRIRVVLRCYLKTTHRARQTLVWSYYHD